MNNMPESGVRLENYYQNYFSGAQARLYFSTDGSGEHIPGFNFVEYSISSNKAPVYGYNDKYFKVIANGNYLVQGRMGFNLTSKDRLYKVFNAAVPKTVSMTSQPSIVVRNVRNNQILSLEKTLNNKIADGQVLKALVDEHKRIYWGTENSGVKRYRFDEMDLDDNGDIVPRGFDAVLLFGYPIGTYQQYFVKTIHNIHIIGESMQVTDDGRNTLIVYDFFARSVDDHESVYDKVFTSTDEVKTLPTGDQPVSTESGNTAVNNTVLGPKKPLGPYKPDDYIPPINRNIVEPPAIYSKIEGLFDSSKLRPSETTPEGPISRYISMKQKVPIAITDSTVFVYTGSIYSGWSVMIHLNPPSGININSVVGIEPEVKVLHNDADTAGNIRRTLLQVDSSISRVSDLDKYISIYVSDNTGNETVNTTVIMAGLSFVRPQNVAP
jgi:hypothetical protein